MTKISSKIGVKLSAAHKDKLSLAMKGKPSHFAGHHHSNKSRNKISKSLLGDRHPRWKGGKPKCVDCGAKLSDYGVARCKPCATKFHVGKNNPNWHGGVSRAPYHFEFDSKLRDGIRKRDDYTCQNCGMTEEEHLIVLGKVLNVHHIDYDKSSVAQKDLITLCFWCNIRANSNRGYWKEFYSNKMKERGFYDSKRSTYRCAYRKN